MPFDWRGFLELAHSITAGKTVSEAEYRTAVSRAYYAVFHVALEYCVNEGYTVEHTSGDHQRVRDWLTELGLGTASINLYELHRLRKQADYDDPPEYHVFWLWKKAEALAREILNELDAAADGQ